MTGIKSLWKDKQMMTEENIGAVQGILEVAAYICQLLNETKCSYCQKRRKFSIREVIFLHDYIHLSTDNRIREMVVDIHRRTLGYISYRHDLSSCYYLTCLGFWKKALWGKWFGDGIAVEASVRNWRETCLTGDSSF